MVVLTLTSVCVCVCACMGWFSGTHTKSFWVSGVSFRSEDDPGSTNRLLINLGGSRVPSSIIRVLFFPQYLFENLFFYTFLAGLLHFFWGHHMNVYTPWKWGKIHVPSYTGTSMIPRNPPHVCMHVCVTCVVWVYVLCVYSDCIVNLA